MDQKKWFLPPSDPADSLELDYNPNAEVEKRPNCINVKLNSSEYKFLIDSIISNLNKSDFQDNRIDYEDGINVYMFSTFKNCGLIETELSNYFTISHLKLFSMSKE